MINACDAVKYFLWVKFIPKLINISTKLKLGKYALT